jgi:beta-lactamase superfamily II metal-dependent hydrolase
VIYGRVAGNVGRAESADFSNFKTLDLVLQTDFNDPAPSNLYNPAAIKYAGATNVYFMFPSLYQHGPDTLDIRLAVSRDGIRWTYPDQNTPYIPLGAPGTWDSASLYMGQGVIQAGDETWLYYSGSPQLHNKTELEDLVHCKQPRAMSRLVIRRDRFVSVDGGKKGGWFITPPLQFTGNALKLNVAVRNGGSIRVGVLDAAGKPLPERGLADCVPITGDHLDAVVRWKNGGTIASQPNRPIRLRIELNDASVFGFQFGDALPAGLPTAGTFRLWQIPAHSSRDVMMSYVLQTESGKLVVIDGGWEADAPYLKTFLQGLGGHVHTWFITHQHDDHLGALTAILRHPEGVTIGRVYASLLGDEWIKGHEPDQLQAVQSFNKALAASNKPVIPAHLGEKLSIEGLSFQVLSVANDSIRDTGNHINNQCMVLRLATSDASVLFLADLGEPAGQRLLAGPFGSSLRSDYVQMAHHGQRGVGRNVYDAVRPNFALWPTPMWLYQLPDRKTQIRFETLTVRSWMRQLGIEVNYVAKDGITELALPM